MSKVEVVGARGLDSNTEVRTAIQVFDDDRQNFKCGANSIELLMTLSATITPEDPVQQLRVALTQSIWMRNRVSLRQV